MASRPTEDRPRTRSGSWRSLVVARELFVDAPLECRIEIAFAVEARIERRIGLSAARPAPGTKPEQHGRDRDAADRQPPGEQPEPAPGRRGEVRVSVLVDHAVLDLSVRVTCSDALRDHP